MRPELFRLTSPHSLHHFGSGSGMSDELGWERVYINQLEYGQLIYKDNSFKEINIKVTIYMTPLKLSCKAFLTLYKSAEFVFFKKNRQMIGLSTVLVNIVMWYQLLYKYLSLLSSVGAVNYLAIYLHLIYHYVLSREMQCSLNEL